MYLIQLTVLCQYLKLIGVPSPLQGALSLLPGFLGRNVHVFPDLEKLVVKHDSWC
jgi:hypothetical protein